MQRLAVLAILVLTGCPSDDAQTCGPDGAASTISVTPETGVTFEYGNFTAHDNGDCPDLAMPNVRSLTLFGASATGDTIALCIARPDQMAKGLAVQNDTTTDGVQLVTLKGTATNGCKYSRNFAAGSTGTLTGSGVCKNGQDPAGFAITLDVTTTMDKTCGTDPAVQVPVTLSGDVAVTFVPAT